MVTKLLGLEDTEEKVIILLQDISFLLMRGGVSITSTNSVAYGECANHAKCNANPIATMAAIEDFFKYSLMFEEEYLCIYTDVYSYSKEYIFKNLKENWDCY